MPQHTPHIAPAPLARDRIDLGTEADRQAWIDWSAHVDAGRIGATARDAAAAPPTGEVRFASLARILGRAAGGKGAA